MSRPLKLVVVLALGMSVLMLGYFGMWALMALALDFETSRNEVVRVRSPLGDADAVVVETNGGATTSFGYLILIVPADAPADTAGEVAYLYGARRSERAYGVNLKWRDSSQLVVEYLEAQHAELSHSTLLMGDERLQVSLQSGVSDSTALPGGMLYNLRGGRS